MLLTREQVEGTRAIPYRVDHCGYVHAFTVGRSNVILDGKLLRVGIDGELYAVFADCCDAETVACLFPACDQYDNAYHLAKVH